LGGRIRHEIETLRGPATFETDAYAVTVKRVCRECNHGWMEREVEKPNQTLLPPMFRGEQISLTSAEQQHVATWAFKTHLMAQYRHIPFRPQPEEQLQWLYQNRTAAPKSRVWLAAFAGVPLHHAWGRTYAFELFAPAVPDVAPADVLYAEMMTLCVGQLVFQSFKWTGAVPEFDVGLPDETAKFVLPIWPPSNVTLVWPPAFTLDTLESVRNFADAFVNTGEPPS